MQVIFQDNWRQRSRGFLRDWAEDEPEDDPSKNYPFPVPPLRTNATMINNYEDEYAPHVHKKEIPVPPNNLAIPDIKVSTPDRMTDNEEHEYCYVDPHTINVRTPQGDNNNNQDVLQKRRMSHLMSFTRHTRVKSIMAEPPSAGKEEVARARCKLQPTTSSTQM